MNGDLIIYDGEFSTAAREIRQYIEFLLSKITEYNRCLKYVQEKGIEDEVIRAKLKNLSALLLDFQKELKTVYMQFDSDARMFQISVCLSDHFSFPGDTMDDLLAALRSLI